MVDFKIYETVNELPSDWNNLVKHDIFLHASYLKALQHASPNNISWFYLGVFIDKQLVGVAIVQRWEFNAYGSAWFLF